MNHKYPINANNCRCYSDTRLQCGKCNKHRNNSDWCKESIGKFIPQINNNPMGSLHARLDKAVPILIEADEPVTFNQIVTVVGTDVKYDLKNGRFKLEPIGTYLINWGVAIEGSYQASHVSFAIFADNVNINDASFPITVGKLHSSCIVRVEDKPVIIKLKNNTGETVRLSQYVPVANIVIAKISN